VNDDHQQGDASVIWKMSVALSPVIPARNETAFITMATAPSAPEIHGKIGVRRIVTRANVPIATVR